MLVLSRKVGQALSIGEKINVIVLEVQGRKVRLGITAPQESLILRDELKRPSPEDRRASLVTGRS